MKGKRGELSIQVVVMAIIALIVLGVVTYIFWDNISDVSSGFKDARKQTACRTDFLGGQKCVSSCNDLAGDWEKADARCQDPDLVCCQKVPDE